MKRPYLLTLALAAGLFLVASGQAGAEGYTFLGKTYCPIKYEIRWPFIVQPGSAVPAQAKNIMPNTYELPKDQPAQARTAVSMGSDMERLHILTTALHVGQQVLESEVLATYELPPANRIIEKEALSRAKVNDLTHRLAWVDLELAKMRNKQEDLEKQSSIQTVASNTLALGQKELDAYLIQRAALSEQLELAQSRHEFFVDLAKARYGKEVDAKNPPREGRVRAPMDGYVLWVNPNLRPGMSFTREAPLFIVGRLDPILIRAAVHEIASQKLKEGDQATVVFHSLPGETFTVPITRVSRVAQPAMMQQPSFYEVELTMPNPDLRMKEGMRCDITVNLPDAAK